MNMQDIYPKVEAPINQLSVYINGAWQFAVPTNPVRYTDNNTVKYYKINNKFGVLKSTQSNAHKTALRGEAGDFLVEDQNRNFAVMKMTEYRQFFPPSRTNSSVYAPGTNKTSTVTSEALKDVKFIEDIVQINRSDESNNGEELPQPDFYPGGFAVGNVPGPTRGNY